MDILEHARRRAFSLWLRTGRLPRWARGETAEVKYNPWHDADDGRFTFAGTGRYFGRGSSNGGARSVDARMSNRPKEPPGGSRGGGRGFNGGGASGSYGGGGQGFNGGGASGSWDQPTAKPRRAPQTKPRDEPAAERLERLERAVANGRRPRRGSVDDPATWRTERKNGYTYRVDPLGRTRHVFGTLSENRAQRRSPTEQQRAGRPDRRPTDQGGHYIARRFNGPTEAFNHFAQDANFNRSSYSALENEWSGEMRRGKTVFVSIEPQYEGSSQRPSRILVTYWISGRATRRSFPNEPAERRNAKR
ncbi:MAG TPA: DNA/RNA non-specific endonuclease [Croceibacterium sp.]